MQKGKVYIDNGCFVVDLTYKSDTNFCDILSISGHDEKVLRVEYIRRNHLKICHEDLQNDGWLGYKGDISPLDKEYIDQALPEFITTAQIPIKNWRGKVVRYKTVRCLTDGWIELKPNDPVTVITSNYRIYK